MPALKTETLLTVERLREVIDYDPLSGSFTWKVRVSRSIPIGAHAGCRKAGGYRYIRIDNVAYLAQRLAWLYVHGEWPDRLLRFADGNRQNCAIGNLTYPDHPPAVSPEYKTNYRLNNPDAARRSILKLAFGISLEAYQAMFVAQNGVCAICKYPEIEGRGGKPKWLAVDHCHDTGIVRGLLCTACNTTLGRMGDDPARLRAAADYIEKSRVAPAEADNVIRLIARKAS